MNNNNPTSGGSIAVNTGGSAQLGATIVGTRKGLRNSLQQLLQGFQAVVPDGSSLPVGSGTEAKADIVAELTQVLSVYANAEAQQMVAKTARTQVQNARGTDHDLFTKLKDAVVAYFGKGNPLLMQFGIKPRAKARPLTPEQLVLRAAKVRGTRAARHTMGARQKAAVKSDGKLVVTVSAVTPGDPTVAPAVNPKP